MRKTSFSGSFYEASPVALDSQIKECFLSKLGPGKFPEEKTDRVIKAVIAPHAGYYFSGACAAHAYKELAEAKMPDIFIIFGPNHSSHKSGISTETIETPFGMLRCDQSFGRALAKKGNIELDEEIHTREHSIEVQLPFLQFIFKDKIEHLKILPILVSQDIDLKQLAIDIKETLVEEDKTACFIVSTDFTHQGVNYGYMPFKDNIKENLEKMDLDAVELIKKKDSEGFRNFVQENQATICGAMPILLLLNILNAEQGKLLKYYTSGEVVGDYSSSVSYVSMVFE